MWARLLIVIACGAAAALALTQGKEPFKDWSSQVLWLAVNVVIVTLAIEALLGADLQRRRRRDLEFGFQTRVALLLEDLIRLTVRSADDASYSAMQAIGLSRHEYAERVDAVARQIAEADDLVVEHYDEMYSTAWALLDDLARNYVRLFSRNRVAMRDNFRKVSRTARRWRFMSDLAPAALEDLARLTDEVSQAPHPDWAKDNLKEATRRFEGAKADALTLSLETGELLMDVLQQHKGPLIDLAP